MNPPTEQQEVNGNEVCEIEELEEEEKEEAVVPKFEELVRRFREKISNIPEECHAALMYWKIGHEYQETRIAGENKLRQISKVSKNVFWDDTLPNDIRKALVDGEAKYLPEFVKREKNYINQAEKCFKKTQWYNEVAIPAAEGYGLGPSIAGELLWTIGCASRFPTFGRFVKYAGLDVTPEGKAPKRKKGTKVTWNPKLRTALYKLTEVWNRNPECVWRARWDGHKAFYRDKYPEKETYEVNGEKKTRYNDGHIHNMARRKIQREFLRNLYMLWLEYEQEQKGEGYE